MMIWKRLTRREAVVAMSIVSGQTRLEVSGRLGMSPRTFDTHRNNVLRKIGARNEVEALVIALAEGVVRVESDPPRVVAVPGVDDGETVVRDVHDVGAARCACAVCRGLAEGGVS